MDYSLLVGIHYRDRARAKNNNNNNLNAQTKIVIDHSGNDNKFEPGLTTVDEDKEENDNKPNKIISISNAVAKSNTATNNNNNSVITPFNMDHDNMNHPEITPNPVYNILDNNSAQNDDNIFKFTDNISNVNINSSGVIIDKPKAKANAKTKALSPLIIPNDKDNNDNKFKITITPTTATVDHDTKYDDVVDVSVASNQIKNKIDLMPQSRTDSTTIEYNTDDDDDDLLNLAVKDNKSNSKSNKSNKSNKSDIIDISDDDNLKFNVHKVNGASLAVFDEYNADIDDDDLDDNHNYYQNRRSSAPIIVSPKGKQINNINIINDNNNIIDKAQDKDKDQNQNHDQDQDKDKDRKKGFKLFKFKTLSNDDLHFNKRKNKHFQSQSHDLNDLLQSTTFFTTTASGADLPQINPKSKSALKPKTSSILSNSKSSINVFNKASSLRSPVHKHKIHRHISVKHPKHYKIKTPQEMQFAIDDIRIFGDISPKMSNISPKNTKKAKDNNNNKNTDDNTEKKIDKNNTKSDDINTKIDDNNTVNKHNTHPSISLNESKHNNDIDNTLDDDDDNVCPWTTYHGGMVYEDDDDGNIGNEIYFVGIIDVLQKYNKRKKLENWIKKMKYDKHSISAAPPDLYAQRMCDFFEDKVI